MLAEIWCEVLQVERVGIHDNFFELGGHSLLAARIMTRVRTVFQINPPLRTLFEQPTIAHLSQVIEQGRLQSAAGRSPQVRALPRRGQPAQLLDKLNQLSESEVKRMLDEKKTSSAGGSSHE
jgi:acyl carrier protein